MGHSVKMSKEYINIIMAMWVGKSNTIPISTIPTQQNPQVYLYLCFCTKLFLFSLSSIIIPEYIMRISHEEYKGVQ